MDHHIKENKVEKEVNIGLSSRIAPLTLILAGGSDDGLRFAHLHAHHEHKNIFMKFSRCPSLRIND